MGTLRPLDIGSGEYSCPGRRCPGALLQGGKGLPRLGPAGEGAPGLITVTVNGKSVETEDVKNGRLELKEYRLYELYHGDKPINGLLRLKTSGPLKAHAFTFG